MDELAFRADLALTLLAGRAEAEAQMQRRHDVARRVVRASRAADRALRRATELLEPASLHHALHKLTRRTRRLLRLVSQLQPWQHDAAALREDVESARGAIGGLIRFQLQQLRDGAYAAFATGPTGGSQHGAVMTEHKLTKCIP